MEASVLKVSDRGGVVEDENSSREQDNTDRNFAGEDTHNQTDSEDLSEISDLETYQDLPGYSKPSTDTSASLGLKRAWGSFSYDDYDVITVHGLRDDHTTVWTSLTGKPWVKDDLFKDIDIRQLDYRYAIDESSAVYGPNGIHDEAANLLREYHEKRSELDEVLIQASQGIHRQDYDDLEAWESARKVNAAVATLSTTIIFLGCPHRSESLETLEDEIFTLISLPGPELKKDRVRKIKNITNQVEAINTEFLQSKLMRRSTNINIYHLKDLPDEEKTKSTVDPPPVDDATDGNTENDSLSPQETLSIPIENSQLSFTGLPKSPRAPFGRYSISTFTTFDASNQFRLLDIDHVELVRGDEKSEPDENWVSYMAKRFRDDHCPLNIQPDLIDRQLALLSLTPPIRPPKMHMDHRDIPKPPAITWLINQKAFKVIKNGIGHRLLCIQGPKDSSRNAMLSQYLHMQQEFDVGSFWEDEVTPTTFYFEFVKFDNRYNTIKSMLITFISEMTLSLSQDQACVSDIDRILKFLEHYQTWSLSTLFRLFTELRCWRYCCRVTLLLGCFDNCVEEERKWFLERFQEQSYSEITYKMIITTSGLDRALTPFVDDSNTLKMEDSPIPFQGFNIDERGRDAGGLEDALECLLAQRPIMERLRKTIENVLVECRDEPYLGYAILNWLSYFGRGTSVEDITSSVKRLSPVTPENLLNIILGALPGKEHQRAALIYSWVKSTVEPLTIKGLGHAIAASMPLDQMSSLLLDMDYQQLEADIQRFLPAIVVVESNEVKLSHDAFNQTLTTDGDKVDADDQDSQVHASIANACLQYLTNDCARQRYPELSINSHGGAQWESSTLISDCNFLQYAVKYWAHHYRNSGTHKPIDKALGFLDCKNVRDLWAEAYFLLENPFTRTERSYLSSLPLIAALGLEDVVSRQVSHEQNSPWFLQDAWLAIAEARKYGHKGIVNMLLAVVKADGRGLRDTLSWTVKGDDRQDQINTELLAKLSGLREFSWTEEMLFSAIAMGSEVLVSAIAKTGFDLSKLNEAVGQTPLNFAIFYGQRHMVKLLLAFGPDLRVRDRMGFTPLFISVDYGDQEIVQMLIDKGSDIHEKMDNGRSVVNHAISLGQHRALATLLTAGGEFKSGESDADLDGPQYPIITAANDSRMKCLEILLDYGADPLTRSKKGSVLYICCDTSNLIEVCRRLLDNGADPNEFCEDREMLLIKSIRTDSTELVELLIESGASINCQDIYTNTELKTPLSFAASSNGSLDILRLLLHRNASVNFVPEGGETALFTAAYRQWSLDKIKLLLNKGAEINWKRKDDDWTALHAGYDAPDTIELLLNHKADVNAICDWGTITMMAAKRGFKRSLEVILAHKDPPPDIDMEVDYFKGGENDENRGKTALRQAVDNGQYECASLLLEAGARLDEMLIDGKYLFQFEEEQNSAEGFAHFSKVVEQCVARGTKVGCPTENDNTPLHRINSRTPVPKIQLFVSMGTPIDSTNSHGWTPLANAVKSGNLAARA
ncbi:hypothetical protein H9Q74_013689 [Fusarium xylarioides]|nr:hypothetical protein H9Q74_013689 [Fusarium xylarioides]